MSRKLIISSILYFLLTLRCFSAEHDIKLRTEYPINNPVPGGIAVVNLKLQNKIIEPPVVEYNNKKIMVRKFNSNWQAIVGLSLNTKQGMHKLKIVTDKNKVQYQEFKTENKVYQKQYIKIKDKGKVNLSPSNLKRAISDKKISQKSFKVWTQKNNIDLRFIMPVKGRISGRFGLKRYFNNKPRKPHSGIDIAAITGTSIISPASGTVITTGNFFFNGKVVFVEHGQGLVTMFCHMDKINVKKGQILKQGDKIGEVGKTGRVTGAHLHFSVSLNQTRIDPELLLPPIPELLNKN